MVSLLASSSLPVPANPELSNINFIPACSAQSHRFMDCKLYRRLRHGKGGALRALLSSYDSYLLVIKLRLSWNKAYRTIFRALPYLIMFSQTRLEISVINFLFVCVDFNNI